MNAIITDKEALYSLVPSEIAAYLRSTGWEVIDKVGSKGAVWGKELPSTSDSAELLLPLDRSLSDYVRRVNEALSTLQIVEERSQIDILRDISDTSYDIIRVQLQNINSNDGSLPIEQASQIVAYAREMIVAAACATIQPRVVYRSRKAAPVQDYMSKVRLGQTERGSYVLTIRSPLPPQLSTPQLTLPEMQDESVPITEETPFERRVTLQLAKSLAATNNALPLSSATGEITAFEQVINQGVSANLCDAIAGMGLSGLPHDIGIRVSWASTRRAPIIPSNFRFSADTLPFLAQVAKALREQAPFGTVDIYGPVVELKREEGALSGNVVIASVVDGKIRRINVQLFGDDYDTAIQAHQFEAPVNIEGELEKEGNLFRLSNPRNISYAI